MYFIRTIRGSAPGEQQWRPLAIPLHFISRPNTFTLPERAPAASILHCHSSVLVTDSCTYRTLMMNCAAKTLRARAQSPRGTRQSGRPAGVHSSRSRMQRLEEKMKGDVAYTAHSQLRRTPAPSACSTLVHLASDHHEHLPGSSRYKPRPLRSPYGCVRLRVILRRTHTPR